MDRIPSNQIALEHRPHGFQRRLVIGQRIDGEIDAKIPATGTRDEGIVADISQRHFLRRNIGELRLRAIGHWLPVVRAVAGWRRDKDSFFISCFRIFNRTAGFHIDARCPVHGHEILGRDQFPVAAIDDVEKPVLGCLHHYFFVTAADFERREDDRLRLREIPRFTGHALIMPLIFAGIGIERNDRRDEQIVALPVRAQAVIPWRAIAHTDQDLIEILVVNDRVPDGATTTEFGPVAVPSRLHFGNDLVRRRAIGFRSFGWRHSVETPRQLAGRGVIRTDIAAHTIFTAAVADKHAAFDDARRASDRIGFALIDRHSRPRKCAGFGVDSDQPPIERADIDFAFVDCRPAVDHIATSFEPGFAGHFGVIGP